MVDRADAPAARVVALGGAVLAGAVMASAATAATASVARRLVRPRPASPDVAVLGADPAGGRVRLAPSPDSLLPGVYSLWFDGRRGHARIGQVIRRTGREVERELLGVDTGEIEGASRGRFNGWVHLSPAGLGLPFEDVRVQTTLGPAPAWLVPAERDDGRWAVHVHGRRSVRQEVLRGVPAFRAAGWSSMLISYRDDGEGPPSAESRYALGDTEWLDVEAAVLHALDRGAREVVLVGWSLGAAIVLQTVTRSRIASVISGAVLDSAVLDWGEVVRLHGRGMGLLPPVQQGVLRLAGSRVGGLLTGEREPIDLGRLDFAERAAEIGVPVLLLHSDDDAFAPPAAARRLARQRPDLVRLVPFRGARHARLWNLDPARWEAAVTAWLVGDEAALARLTGLHQPRSTAQRA